MYGTCFVMEVLQMEFSFDFKSLKSPKRRLLLGILLLVVGIICVSRHTWNFQVTRENCALIEATYKECKFHSLDSATDANSIYLTFTDYVSNLDIHSSCADDRLTQALMDLESGTKMRLLANEANHFIYELEVGGDTWLSFEEAITKIEKNMTIVMYAGYALLAMGSVLFLTAIYSLVKEPRR